MRGYVAGGWVAGGWDRGEDMGCKRGDGKRVG